MLERPFEIGKVGFPIAPFQRRVRTLFNGNRKFAKDPCGAVRTGLKVNNEELFGRIFNDFVNSRWVLVFCKLGQKAGVGGVVVEFEVRWNDLVANERRAYLITMGGEARRRLEVKRDDIWVNDAGVATNE